jgi:hypothetical protein
VRCFRTFEYWFRRFWSHLSHWFCTGFCTALWSSRPSDCLLLYSNRLWGWRWLIFWDIASCSLVEVDRRCGGAHCLRRQTVFDETARLSITGDSFSYFRRKNPKSHIHWICLIRGSERISVQKVEQIL